jgi:hypothetical protein
MELQTGERVYYTGDMANQPDWCTITGLENHNVKLQMDNGGETWVWDTSIGHVYQGHCNPRFVTQAAYDTWRAARMNS